MDGKQQGSPLYRVEDTFNNMRALCRLMLFVFENTSDGELMALKSELVSMLYLLFDQVQDGQKVMNDHAAGVTPPPLHPDPVHAPA